MCELISTILGSIGLAMGVGGATAGGIAGGTVVATTASVVAGGVAAASTIAGIAGTAMGVVGSIQSSRANAAAQRQQAEAMKKLQENQGTLENSKVTNGLQENSRPKRTLSSLRVGLLAQNQDQQEITRNVYGVDTNSITSSTQNMMGLNIVVA